MEVVHFIYNGQTIDFLPGRNDNLMVNATQMAKIFGKEVARFMENDSTKKFIEVCLNRAEKTRNSSFINGKKSEYSHFFGVKTETDLVISKQKSGT